MIPSLPIKHTLDSADIYTVFVSQIRGRHNIASISESNAPNSFVRKLSEVIVLSLLVYMRISLVPTVARKSTSLLGFISVILGCCPEPQMIWTATGGIISTWTVMADAHIFGDRAVGAFIRIAMRKVFDAIFCETTVAVFVAPAYPFTTAVLNVDKSVIERWPKYWGMVAANAPITLLNRATATAGTGEDGTLFAHRMLSPFGVMPRGASTSPGFNYAPILAYEREVA